MTLDRLAHLATLQEDWDSYGAAPITSTAIDTARSCLATIAAEPFDIAPIPDGGVGLEWRQGTRLIEVEIGPDGTFGYLVVERHQDGERFSSEVEDAPWAVVRGAIEEVLRADP